LFKYLICLIGTTDPNRPDPDQHAFDADPDLVIPTTIFSLDVDEARGEPDGEDSSDEEKNSRHSRYTPLVFLDFTLLVNGTEPVAFCY